MDLSEALTRAYDFDAMMTMYVPRGATRFPRINKAGYSLYPEQLVVTVFFADWDTPNHTP